MSSHQKVILLGNLGRDPELRYVPSGAPVANFSMATSESWKDKNSGEKVEKTTWHNIVLWRGLAETASQYLKKGDKVYIEGKIQIRDYTDKDGVQRRAFEIVGDEMKMLGKAAANGNGGTEQHAAQPTQPASQPAAPTSQQPTAPESDSLPPGISGDDDDLPF